MLWENMMIVLKGRERFSVFFFIDTKNSDNKQKSQHPDGYWLLWCAGRVRESTAAGGGCRETDEVKTTSRQEGIYAVAVCDIVFSGRTLWVRVLVENVYKNKKTQSFD